LGAEEISEHYNGIFKNEANLQLCYHFDEATGDTVKDSSGFDRHGTKYGSTSWQKEGFYSGISFASSKLLLSVVPVISSIVQQSGKIFTNAIKIASECLLIFGKIYDQLIAVVSSMGSFIISKLWEETIIVN